MSRQELREQRDRDRRNVLAEVASLITHQLHQPLTAIVNYSASARSALAQTHPDPQELATHLERISDQAFRAAEISRCLRELVRRPAHHAAEIALRPFLEQTWQWLEPQAGWTLELEVPTSSRVVFDPAQLRFVLEELLTNCADSLERSEGPDHCVRIIAGPSDAEQLELVVTDSGAGFTPAAMDEAFTPFRSTREGQLGLGLSVARSIVADQGGRLRVDSQTNGGACLRLLLPGSL